MFSEILEQIHLDFPKKIHLFERKISLEDENSIISGPARCGKSSLILKKLFELKKDDSFYIDFADLRTPKELTFDEIVNFSRTKKIAILAIENAPFLLNSITGLTIFASQNEYISQAGFETIEVGALDFEEYIASGHKEIEDTAHLFAQFLKDGNLPEKAGKNELKKLKLTQQAIVGISEVAQKRELFKYLCKSGGLKLTFLQMYNFLRESSKFSKDSLYRYSKELEDEGAVYFVEKFGQKNGAKKIYLYDFSMISALSYKKEPLRVFENMIFLELAKENQEIYYTDSIDFLMADAGRAVMAKPFATIDVVLRKMSETTKLLKMFEIELLEVVTMGAEFTFEQDSVLVEAMPFWIWALKG
jgi:uncharacterized protein